MTSLLKIIKKSLGNNIFDEFVANGATRLDEFPRTVLWQEKAQKFFLDNLTINYGSRGGVWVAGQEDAIIIADWRKENVTKVLIKDVSHNPHVFNHRKAIRKLWSKHNQPYLFGSLRVGFGCKGDQYVASHPGFQRAEQVGDGDA